MTPMSDGGAKKEKKGKIPKKNNFQIIKNSIT